MSTRAPPLGRARRARLGGTTRREMRQRARGFTLVEVLVALAIVAVALGAGFKAAGALLDNAERLADVSAAQWCADNQLTGLKLGRQFPGIGDSDFACEQLGRSYSGKLAVRPTPNPNFRRVDANIADAQGQPVLTLSTVLPRY
jgi:general secretion pathway protein I